MKIAIISSSVRIGRLSHRVAIFLRDYLTAKGVDAQVLDLKEYDFPLFSERFFAMPDPQPKVSDYVARFTDADGVIIVSPVYNASYPAALKNVIDLLVGEWAHKPVAVTSVTYGQTAGIQTAQQLQGLMLKLGARVAAPLYTVVEAEKNFSEDGVPADAPRAEKYVAAMIDELLWLVEKSKNK